MEIIRFFLISVVFIGCLSKKKESVQVINANITTEELQKELTSLTVAINSKPDDPSLYNKRGVYFTIQKDFDNAKKDFDKAIGLDSTDATTWDNRGTLKARMNDYMGAREDYKVAAELSPLNAQFLNNLGWSSLNLGSYLEALALFDKAIDLDKGLAQPFLNKGLALIALKRPDEGCSYLSLAKEKGCGEANGYIRQYCSQTK